MNRFDNIDCMIGMAEYEDNHFDLAIVDPPYGIERFQQTNRDGKKNTTVNLKASQLNKWDIKPKQEYFEELFRVSKNQIIWGANNFNLPTSEYFLVWDKMQYMPNFSSAELAYVSMGLKKPAKVFRYAICNVRDDIKRSGGRIHPTQKPVKLYEWILMNYAKENDKILDTHVGSASSLIACEDMGFNYVGFEIDKDYYDSAQKRLTQFRSQSKLAI